MTTIIVIIAVSPKFQKLKTLKLLINGGKYIELKN